MDLSEIEAKADELAAEMLAADGRNARTHHMWALEGLHRLAQIKATVAYRKERESERAGQQAAYQLGVPTSPAQCPATEFNRGQIRSCLAPAGHKPAGAHIWSSWLAARIVDDEPELTKPTVDRLHELVSYLTEASREQGVNAGEADQAWHLGQAKAYDDAAGKLQEILSEGGL